MENKSDCVILEIEGTPVECSKKVLIQNSDYFSAMFTGSFKESSLARIKIEGVDLNSFNTILLLLWNKTYVIQEEEIHSILQAASMLQFNAIKQLCEDRLLEILNPANCLKIWKTTEILNISPLWLKAKCMALEEFSNICDNHYILELSLDDICSYLGHIYLNVKTELTVFQTAMSWWYENQDLFEHEDCTKVILRLLNCIDYSKLEEDEIKEIQSYPDVVDKQEIVAVLNCIINLKENGINVASNFSPQQLSSAIHFCNSENRKKPLIPSVLLQNGWVHKSCPNKKSKYGESNAGNSVIFASCPVDENVMKLFEWPPNSSSDVSLVLYDALQNEFKHFFNISADKIRDLTGFKLQSYKEFILLYGGEYLIGGGNWNCNIWTYNTFKEKWERKNMLPQGRRHFESILVDDCIYIIGGVGRFRVIQENLFWYDFTDDKWSSVIPLPNEARHLKCGSFKGQLFIVYLYQRRAYFFNKKFMSWIMIDIMIEKEIVDDMGEFAVFSDADYFYIKGKYLLTFSLKGDNLVPVKQRMMKDIESEEIESVLCGSIVYTLYKCLNERYEIFYTFESFNLETEKLYYIFENKVQGKDPLRIGDKIFCTTQHSKLFYLHNYNLVKDNVCINSSIL